MLYLVCSPHIICFVIVNIDVGKKNINTTDLFNVMNGLRNQISNRKDYEFFVITHTTSMPGTTGLTSMEKNEFKNSALDFYQRAIDYLDKCFNFESSPFKLFTYLKLNKIPSIMELLNLATCIGIQIDENDFTMNLIYLNYCQIMCLTIVER